MNGNYVEGKDGWHKTDQSTTKGTAGYFAKQPPPMRLKNGAPMKNYDEVDTARWIQEVNERDAKQND
jgi:hypothetical protein